MAEGEVLQSLSSDAKAVIVTLGVIINLFGVVGNGSIYCV